MSLEDNQNPIAPRKPVQLHTTSGRWQLGLGLSLVTVVLWGILPVALKVTLEALDIYTVVWFRFTLSFAILAGFLAARGQLPSREKLRSTSWKLLAIASVFLAFNYGFYLQGLAMTSPANAQLLIQLAPVLMGLGALVVFKERYTLSQWIGLGVLISGFILFSHEKVKTVISTPSTYFLGNAILVIGAAAWAVYALAQKQLLQQLSSAKIMCLIYGCCAVLFAPFASPESLGMLTPLQWGMLLFTVMNTVVGYGSFAESLAHWEASKVSAVLATTPIVTLVTVTVVAIAIPTLIPPDRITLLAMVGATLVVSGSIAIALGKKRSGIARSLLPWRKNRERGTGNREQKE